MWWWWNLQGELFKLNRKCRRFASQPAPLTKYSKWNKHTGTCICFFQVANYYSQGLFDHATQTQQTSTLWLTGNRIPKLISSGNVIKHSLLCLIMVCQCYLCSWASVCRLLIRFPSACKLHNKSYITNELDYHRYTSPKNNCKWKLPSRTSGWHKKCMSWEKPQQT